MTRNRYRSGYNDCSTPCILVVAGSIPLIVGM